MIPKPLSECHNIADLREAARRRLPRMVFDYIDGGAEDERTLRANTNAWGEVELIHRALRDVETIRTSTNVLGAQSSLPLVIAPTAATRLFHPKEGEGAVAKAAAEAGITYSISTLGSASIEEIGRLTDGPKWFQVYVWRDRELVAGILDRVRNAGFSGLILTVDAPVAGKRERDPRNGFSIPPKINRKTVSQALMRPGYLFDVATSGAIGPANFPNPGDMDIMDLINTLFDRSVTWDYARWLRDEWGGLFAVKGIGHPDDAEAAINVGADVVWVSNHGGRQLDTAPSTASLLPILAQTINGRAELVVDGGIRRGSDILKALALGANAVAIGRPYLYGVAAGGERGVTLALNILRDELERTMALGGLSSIDDLTADILSASLFEPRQPTLTPIRSLP
ncbi:MAG: alpha-hydroxy acid oxidase [Pseudomonadota bacterium]